MFRLPTPAVRLASPVLWAFAMLSLLSMPSHAEDEDPADRVARISYLRGSVSMQIADDEGWAEARINQPLTSGDQLSTDGQGRSELQMGSTTIQVGANTQLQLLELSDEVLQLKITQGVVNVLVRELGKDDTVEVDTPNASVSAMEPGTYRIEVPDQELATVIQVREGSVDVASERRSFALHADEQLTLRGDDRVAAEFSDLGPMDEFDRWAADRNERAERVTSSRYVGPEVIGYEDLDDYGYWRWEYNYGYVWTPTHMVSGWAPYRYGRWAWVSPWGWTWVDDAPWGFAPFHYGRWTTIGSRWCWVPGPRTVRAVYAPALVAWVGTPGLSISVGIGSYPVGWIPLGPREVYRPAYRSSYHYIVNVNRSNSLLNEHEFERGYRRRPHDDVYHNRRAMSVVTADTLRSARPVRGRLIRSDDLHLQPITDTSTLQPQRNRVPVGSRRADPSGTNQREVIARRRPMPIEDRQPDRVRVIETPTVRSGNVDRGRGPEVRRDDGNGNHGARDNARAPGSDDRWSTNRSRSTTLPYVDPENRSDRNTQPQPNVPAIAPPSANPGATEPRVRGNPWIRDEQRLGGRERSGNEYSAPPVQRPPAMPPRNNFPQRGDMPRGTMPPPMQPSRPTIGESNRSDNGSGRKHGRGPGGDAR